MNIKKIIILTLIAAFPLSMTAATVYMKKEPDGSTSFSDTPSKGSEKVKIDEPNIIKGKSAPKKAPPEVPEGIVPPTGVPKSGSSPSRKPPGSELPQKEVYKSVEITNPKSEETIWNPSSISVNVSVTYGDTKTGLQEGDKITLYLDGRKVGDAGTSMSYTLSREQVPRGTHTLYASVVNENGTTLITSKSNTFYIHMTSIASAELKTALKLLRK